MKLVKEDVSVQLGRTRTYSPSVLLFLFDSVVLLPNIKERKLGPVFPCDFLSNVINKCGLDGTTAISIWSISSTYICEQR